MNHNKPNLMSISINQQPQLQSTQLTSIITPITTTTIKQLPTIIHIPNEKEKKSCKQHISLTWLRRTTLCHPRTIVLHLSCPQHHRCLNPQFVFAQQHQPHPHQRHCPPWQVRRHHGFAVLELDSQCRWHHELPRKNCVAVGKLSINDDSDEELRMNNGVRWERVGVSGYGEDTNWSVCAEQAEAINVYEGRESPTK